MAFEKCAAPRPCRPTNLGGRWRRAGELLPFMLLASAVLPQHAMAETVAPQASQTSVDAFRDVCVRSGARLDAVIAAAEATGFTRSSATPAIPRGMTKVVALEQGRGDAKRVVVVSVGTSAVSKSLTAEVPVRGCAMIDTTAAWDVRGFARSWLGIAPLLDADGVVAYNYLERATGNVSAPENDVAALVDGVNAGELRTLVLRDSGNARALSWVVFEIPTPPLVSPAALAAQHEADPFTPCKWETSGTGKKSERRLSCPDPSGKFRSALAKGVSEETPALARSGDVAAMLKLATFYSDGPQSLRDQASTVSWSRRAAEAGAAGGAFNLALAYDDGAGIGADKAAAERWYRTAAAQNHVSAMVNLGALLLAKVAGTDTASVAEASGLVRRAADAGSVDAIFDMGHLSENGIGQAKDMNEALRWYRLGAEKKDARAMLRLGLLYADGIGGVPRDEAEGARWLVRGVSRMLGLATVINGIEALAYRFDDAGRRAELSRAATTDPALALKLGLYLADRNNRGRDPIEALRLLRIAADARITMAALCLGVMLAEGDGTPKDDSEAIKWLRADARLRTIGSFQRVTRFTDKALP